MKTLILHIGTMKTGTSTIQRFLSQNRDLLMQQGISYPGERDAHHNIAREIHIPLEYRKDLFGVSDLIRAARRYPAQTILISAEGLALFSAEEVMEFIKRISKRVKVEIRVVVYLRRQDLWLQSCWLEELKTGFHNLSFVDWIRENDYRAYRTDYKALLNRWSRVVGKENITVRVFETSQMINSSLLSDFCSTCGIVVSEEFNVPGKINVSLDVMSLSVCKFIVENLGCTTAPRESHVTFRTNMAVARYAAMKDWGSRFPRYNGLDYTLYREIRDRFTEENRNVAREYLERDTLFLEPFEEKELTGLIPVSEMDPAELLGLLTFILKNKRPGCE